MQIIVNLKATGSDIAVAIGFSIHEIKFALAVLQAIQNVVKADFIEKAIDDKWVVVQKQFGMEVVDFLDTLSHDQVRWYGASQNLEECRFLMLQNLKRVNGVAIFVGEIKEGVKYEYELAKKMGVRIVEIPLE